MCLSKLSTVSIIGIFFATYQLLLKIHTAFLVFKPRIVQKCNEAARTFLVPLLYDRITAVTGCLYVADNMLLVII